MVSRKKEEVVDLIVGKEKSLRLPRGQEPFPLPLPPSGRLLGVLRPVVQTLVSAVFDAGHDLLFRRAVAVELVRHYDARGTRLLGMGRGFRDGRDCRTRRVWCGGHGIASRPSFFIK